VPELEIIIAGDNDMETEGNPGKTKAEETARAFNLPMTLPKICGDFNDIVSRDGKNLQDVLEQLEKTYRPGAIEEKDDWEDPIFLDEHVLPEIKPGLIKGPLGELAEAVSIATETPLELALSMGLATVAAAIQKKFKVMPEPGYSEPLNIWTLTALDPANRKTTVQGSMTKTLTKWEAKEAERLGAERNNALSRRKSQEKRIDKLRTIYASAKIEGLEEIEKEIFAAEAALEDVPPLPRVWSQDITPEYLGTVMAEHGEKAAALSSEGGIFDIMAGRYSNGIPNLDIFLQGHAGDSVRVERGSREPIYMDEPALTMGLSPRPEVLRGLVGKPGFRGRGLLARFLYCLPKSNLGHRTLKQQPISEYVQRAYEIMLFSLLDVALSEDETGKQKPYILKLSKSAYSDWKEFQMAVEIGLREGGKFEHITDWAGKLPGAAIRLAGIIHCALNHTQPWGRDIESETMTSALDLAAIYSEHALVAFGLMGGDQSLERARKVWRWIERNRQPEFSKQAIYQGMKGSFPKVAMLEEPLTFLEERNYIQRRVEGSKRPGRKKESFMVNPKLAKAWQ